MAIASVAHTFTRQVCVRVFAFIYLFIIIFLCLYVVPTFRSINKWLWLIFMECVLVLVFGCFLFAGVASICVWHAYLVAIAVYSTVFSESLKNRLKLFIVFLRGHYRPHRHRTTELFFRCDTWLRLGIINFICIYINKMSIISITNFTFRFFVVVVRAGKIDSLLPMVVGDGGALFPLMGV